MEDRNKKIVEFANKWIPKFADKNVNCYELVETDFGENCLALNFILDQGESFCNKYGVHRADDCINVLDKVDDIRQV